MKKRKSNPLLGLLAILLLLLTVTSALISCAPAEKPDIDGTDNTEESEKSDTEIFAKKQSVLLIGQSNMAGRGDVTSVSPLDNPKITMLRNGEWVPMKEPIHDDKPSLAGVGLGASFASAFVEKFDCEIGLIPGAFGGTSLSDWAVGGNYYNRALEMALTAQKDSEICAILWHQGESDQKNPEYAEQLTVILNCFIRDLGLDKTKIVIITGELGRFVGAGAANVNNALSTLSSAYPNYAVASSEGLTAQDVNTHFDAASLRVFGYRYFAHFYKIITDKDFEFDDDPQNYVLSPS